MTVLEKCNLFPPCLCRLVARKNRKPLSSREIARASNLAIDTVSRLSVKADWTGVKIDVVVRFAAACGVNHMTLKQSREYVRRRLMHHISRGTKSQQKMYARIFRLSPPQ